MRSPADTSELAAWPIAILAGGLATRLQPLTERLPKALSPVAGVPFLAHQLQLLSTAGFRQVVLCVGHLGHMIESEFGDGARYGVDIDYSSDGERLLGTGGALKRALPLLGDRFFVLYGDSYLPIDYGAVAKAFVRSDKPALMTVFRNENRWDASNVIFSQGTIHKYEKGKPVPEMRHIDYGLGAFRSEVLSTWPSNQPFDLADVYRALATEGRLAGYETNCRFYEIGSLTGRADLEQFLHHKLPGACETKLF